MLLYVGVEPLLLAGEDKRTKVNKASLSNYNLDERIIS